MPPNKVGLRLLNWASQLEDKTLDAVTDPSGQVQFAFAEQPT